MRFAVGLLLTVLLVATVFASPADRKQSKQKACMKQCGDDYKPVCAKDSDGKLVTFGNDCVMSNYNCEGSKTFQKDKDGECGGKAPVRLS